MDIVILLFLIGIGIVAAAIFAVMALTGKRSSKLLNQEKYRSDWMRIDAMAKRGDQESLHMALLNADKLLDQALRERGFAGATMGERMKSAQNTWKNANHVWFAHKLRNQIAHEANVNISARDGARAMDSFKQALKDVGAI